MSYSVKHDHHLGKPEISAVSLISAIWTFDCDASTGFGDGANV